MLPVEKESKLISHIDEALQLACTKWVTGGTKLEIDMLGQLRIQEGCRSYGIINLDGLGIDMIQYLFSVVAGLLHCH